MSPRILLSLIILLCASSAGAAGRDEPAAAPMAVFDEAYRAAHRGRISVEVPEVHELVNVAIALTPFADESENLVEKETPYYRAVRERFAPFRRHPFVLLLDREMRARFDRYFEHKMNAYAFEYDARGRIVPSRVYHRTGFSVDPVNHLLPHLDLMRDFSDRSGFRRFYASHRPLFDAQIVEMREIGIEEMMDWLHANFPATRYDSVKVIFSPLVSGSQSATWMSDRGFSELQAHVNFAYPRPSHVGLSPGSVALRKGHILFTELNHGFINPLGDRYADSIEAAFENGAAWSVPDRTASGYGTVPFFNEMMNWGLASLYVAQHAPPAERDRLLLLLDEYMGETGRGFRRFPAFADFLIELARQRPGVPVASLYPDIIDWFAAQEDRRAPSP